MKRYIDEKLRKGAKEDEAADSFIASGSGLSSVVLQSIISASPPSVWLHIHADLKSRGGGVQV